MQYACDLYLPPGATAFAEVRTSVLKVGAGNYLEFCTGAWAPVMVTRYVNLGDTCNRGVYGYISWGYNIKSPGGGVTTTYFSEPTYINYDFQFFNPPQNRPYTSLRVWTRKGVVLHCDFDFELPPTLGGKVLTPGIHL